MMYQQQQHQDFDGRMTGCEKTRRHVLVLEQRRRQRRPRGDHHRRRPPTPYYQYSATIRSSPTSSPSMSPSSETAAEKLYKETSQEDCQSHCSYCSSTDRRRRRWSRTSPSSHATSRITAWNFHHRNARRVVILIVIVVLMVVGTAVGIGDALTTKEVEEEQKQLLQDLLASSDALHQDGDMIEDSFFDPLSTDPSCSDDSDCRSPPKSTIEEVEEEVITTKIDTTCFHGGEADDEEEGDDDADGESTTASTSGDKQCTIQEEEVVERRVVDKHWGKDPKILGMRNKLRENAQNPLNDTRPPIFLMPGLASTRLVAWKFKKCNPNFMSSDIRIQDNVWLNINLVIRMGSIDVDCMSQCLSLGLNQTDVPPELLNVEDGGCKLRPDEGLDAIASLAPGGIGADLLVGGVNTVYAWLIQWLADNMGYDVTNIVGLPYDWRLSPDKMEARDGFLSMMRRRMEAAVSTNGLPGIMVAHSMGNLIFRYFLEWLRVEMREESYARYIRRAERRKQRRLQQQQQQAFADIADDEDPDEDISMRNEKFWELAKHEGDEKWLEWIETHIWTYVGLSAPMMGAVNPLRAIISGENMGLPVNDKQARFMELTFGSTHTVNPISSRAGFCDHWDVDEWGEEPIKSSRSRSFVRRENLKQPDVDERNDDVLVEDDSSGSKLACLDDIMSDIEFTAASDRDPWKDFPTLKALLRDRIDWTTGKPMINVEIEQCQSPKSRQTGKKNVCNHTRTIEFGADSVEDRSIFTQFNELWEEPGSPLLVKKEQLEESFFNTKVPSILNRTWDRPLIKHVIMAYGMDLPTEVGYIYKKKYNIIDDMTENSHMKLIDRNDTDLPNLKTVFWEDKGGSLTEESIEAPRGSIAEVLIKKKPKRRELEVDENSVRMPHSGDGSVPYLSLSWAHTWLLHAARAKRYNEDKDRNTVGDVKNVLDHISVSHRPQGEIEWIEGVAPPKIEVAKGGSDVKLDPDTGTDHPHGTRYKPEMRRYHNVGVSRTTGIVYTTTVVEAVGIEHKETTRNYDILAAVFTEVLRYMEEDMNLV